MGRNDSNTDFTRDPLAAEGLGPRFAVTMGGGGAIIDILTPFGMARSVGRQAKSVGLAISTVFDSTNLAFFVIEASGLLPAVAKLRHALTARGFVELANYDRSRLPAGARLLGFPKLKDGAGGDGVGPNAEYGLARKTRFPGDR